MEAIWGMEDIGTSLTRLTEQVSAGIRSVERRIDDERDKAERRQGETSASLEHIGQALTSISNRVLVLETVSNLQAKGERVGVITLSDLKFYAAVAIGSGSMAVAIVLWVLKVAGKLP